MILHDPKNCATRSIKRRFAALPDRAAARNCRMMTRPPTRAAETRLLRDDLPAAAALKRQQVGGAGPGCVVLATDQSHRLLTARAQAINVTTYILLEICRNSSRLPSGDRYVSNDRELFAVFSVRAVGSQSHSPVRVWHYKFRDRWISVSLAPPGPLRQLSLRVRGRAEKPNNGGHSAQRPQDCDGRRTSPKLLSAAVFLQS